MVDGINIGEDLHVRVFILRVEHIRDAFGVDAQATPYGTAVTHTDGVFGITLDPNIARLHDTLHTILSIAYLDATLMPAVAPLAVATPVTPRAPAATRHAGTGTRAVRGRLEQGNRI